MSSDDLFAPIAPPASSARGVVLCQFDGVIVGVPQQDVATIEHGAQLAAPLAGERVIGWFESERGPWPVYALDRELRPVNEAILNRAFVVFLKSASEPIGLLCESVRIVGKLAELTPQALPEPLASCAPPRTHLALVEDRIAVLFDAGQLAQILRDIDSATLGDTVIHRPIRRVPEPTVLPMNPDTPTVASARAWLLDWPAQPLALALCEVVEIADEPKTYALPFGPPWCRAVLYWRNRFIALAATGNEDAHAHIVVTTFQERADAELRYAAFAVERPPQQITVVDGLDCEAPYGVFGESQLRASFMFESRAIVVPELKKLFASESAAA